MIREEGIWGESPWTPQSNLDFVIDSYHLCINSASRTRSSSVDASYHTETAMGIEISPSFLHQSLFLLLILY